MEPGESGEQTRLGVPLIHVPSEESTPVVPEPEVTLMDVDAEAVPAPVTVGLTDPTSTDGRDAGLPSSVATFAPQMDGPSELPVNKRRRVMFAD